MSNEVGPSKAKAKHKSHIVPLSDEQNAFEAPWKAYYHTIKKMKFYFNSKTKESVWAEVVSKAPVSTKIDNTRKRRCETPAAGNGGCDENSYIDEVEMMDFEEMPSTPTGSPEIMMIEDEDEPATKKTREEEKKKVTILPNVPWRDSVQPRNVIPYREQILTVIPYSVVQELDGLKKNPKCTINANQACRVIQKLKEEKHYYVELETSVEQNIELDVFRPERNKKDDLILNCAIRVQIELLSVAETLKFNSGMIVFVSNDLNLKLKAQAHGITVVDCRHFLSTVKAAEIIKTPPKPQQVAVNQQVLAIGATKKSRAVKKAERKKKQQMEANGNANMTNDEVRAKEIVEKAMAEEQQRLKNLEEVRRKAAADEELWRAQQKALQDMADEQLAAQQAFDQHQRMHPAPNNTHYGPVNRGCNPYFDQPGPGPCNPNLYPNNGFFFPRNNQNYGGHPGYSGPWEDNEPPMMPQVVYPQWPAPSAASKKPKPAAKTFKKQTPKPPVVKLSSSSDNDVVIIESKMASKENDDDVQVLETVEPKSSQKTGVLESPRSKKHSTKSSHQKSSNTVKNEKCVPSNTVIPNQITSKPIKPKVQNPALIYKLPTLIKAKTSMKLPPIPKKKVDVVVDKKDVMSQSSKSTVSSISSKMPLPHPSEEDPNWSGIQKTGRAKSEKKHVPAPTPQPEPRRVFDEYNSRLPLPHPSLEDPNWGIKKTVSKKGNVHEPILVREVWKSPVNDSFLFGGNPIPKKKKNKQKKKQNVTEIEVESSQECDEYEEEPEEEMMDCS